MSFSCFGTPGRRRIAAAMRSAVFALAVTLSSVTGCATGPVEDPLTLPVCADDSGAMVVDRGRGVIRAYSATGAERWTVTPVDSPFTAALADCSSQVFSSSASAWSDAAVEDREPVVHLANGQTVGWPTPGEFTKFRVLAATTVGTGVVATGDGRRVTLRTQVDGRFTDAEDMSAANFDWAISPSGDVAAAYDQGITPGRLVILERHGSRWDVVDRRQLDEPVYSVSIRDRDRFVITTESEYVLHEGDSTRRLAGADEYSEVFLSGEHVVLLQRSYGTDGERTDVKVVDSDLRTVFTKSYPAIVIVSSYPGGDRVLLSVPGTAITITRDGTEESDVPGYVFAGEDGVFLRLGRDHVEFDTQP